MQRDLIRFKGLKFVPLSQQRGRCCSRSPRQLRTEEGSSQQHSPPPPFAPGPAFNPLFQNKSSALVGNVSSVAREYILPTPECFKLPNPRLMLKEHFLQFEFVEDKASLFVFGGKTPSLKPNRRFHPSLTFFFPREHSKRRQIFLHFEKSPSRPLTTVARS